MKQLQADIKSGQFKPFYLLYGEERYLRRQYRDRLKKALCAEGDSMNTHFYEGKNPPIEQIIDLAETMPFLSEHRVIFFTDSGLFSSAGEQLAEYLTSPNESSIFIFSESEVDKRSKLYKLVNTLGYACEFKLQDADTLKRWSMGILSREGKKIRESTLQLFLTKTGTDMNNIEMELEKLICYCYDKEVIEDADVEEICTVHVTGHIFDMIDAISNNQTRRALDLYYDLLALKEPPMRILYLIARQCNLLLQVKELKARGQDNRMIASKVGIPPFVVNKQLTQASKFPEATLRNALRQCAEAEEAVKNGRMNDRISVEILILTVLAKEKAPHPS